MKNYDFLQQLIQGQLLISQELELLLKQELANPYQAEAFNITPENGLQKIKQRSQLFQKVHSQVKELCYSLKFKESDEILWQLWRLWLPLTIQLIEEKNKLERPLIQGILGGQGTGKTTLAAILGLILDYLNYSTISISIDDLYKTYQERQQLKAVDPRLIWRGPPGTHDINLGIQVLDQLININSTQPILVPRFDKSLENGEGDRIQPEPINRADVVLFEGWFVGVRSIDENSFKNPPFPIVTPEDQQFAQDINEQLKAYLPLWERLDRLMVLYPVDYHLSKQWRKEAEHKMIALGKKGMSDEEIDQFVDYFWRSLHPELFMTPLVKNPDLVDLIIEINHDHSYGNVYQPIDN